MGNVNFKPSKDSAKSLAENYWKDLADYSNERLSEISKLIESNASAGKYEVIVSVIIEYQESIIDKLKEAGYQIEISPKDDKYNFIKIKFL